jgi:hypothetical protein
MYININITGSSYTQSTGIIEVTVVGGTPPYLINYRTYNGTTFLGTKVDDGLYLGYPEYTKAINVPVGFYYVDVTDQYGRGTKITECVIVSFSGYTQQIVNNTPDGDIIIFPCIESRSPQYWITTEDGCYINLALNNCSNDRCYLITTPILEP